MLALHHVQTAKQNLGTLPRAQPKNIHSFCLSMVTLHPTDIFETFSESLNGRIGTLPDTASLHVLQEKAWNWSGWIGLVPSLKAVLELPHGSDKQGGALFRVHFWHTFFRSNFCFWSLQASPIFFFSAPTAFRQKIGSPASRRPSGTKSKACSAL